MLSPQTFEQLRDRYPRSSWAIWSETFPRRGCIETEPADLVEYIESQRDKLRPSLVFLGLNPSTTAPSGWTNFHSPSLVHADYVLRILIEEHGLVGGYMTDCSDTVAPTASQVSLDDDVLRTLYDQFALLGQQEYDVICFGRKAFKTVASAIDAESTPLSHKMNRISTTGNGIKARFFGVFHYSQRHNPGNLETLRDQFEYLSTTVLP